MASSQDRHVQKLMDDLDLPPDRANLFEMLLSCECDRGSASLATYGFEYHC